MILDRDRRLVEALEERIHWRGWESHVLDRPATRRLLARMKIDVLIVDPAAIGSDPWGWLELLATGLPSLAVVVCAGPSTVAERVRALELGVDDWLTKPVHPDEVVAHVESAVRRRRRPQSRVGAAVVRAGELGIRVAEQQVFAGDRSAGLTQREFGVLRVLVEDAGNVVERTAIYWRVWGYTMVAGDRSVDVHVRKIRAKLSRVSPGWKYIHTQHRIGYCFEPEQAAG
jgi:DNA-binding response OmpR family regulator